MGGTSSVQILRPVLREGARLVGSWRIVENRSAAVALYDSPAMARELRSNICGGIYHVMNRGNRRALIFEDDRDRKRFVSLLIQFLRSFEVELLVGCLMGNHFHLIVTTPLGNLSWFMQQLEGQFATYSNWRHQRVGHLFQGRFRGVLIESDLHLLIAACYVFVNPVVAGLCDRPEQWKWSTYSSTAGITSAPEYLSLNWVSELFQSASLEACQRLFRKLMDQAHPVQSYLAQADWLAPCEPMRGVLRSYVGDRLRAGALPREYRELFRPNLQELFQSVTTKAERDGSIHDAHVIHGYSCSEIARLVSLRESTVANIVTSIRRQQRVGK